MPCQCRICVNMFAIITIKSDAEQGDSVGRCLCTPKEKDFWFCVRTSVSFSEFMRFTYPKMHF